MQRGGDGVFRGMMRQHVLLSERVAQAVYRDDPGSQQRFADQVLRGLHEMGVAVLAGRPGADVALREWDAVGERHVLGETLLFEGILGCACDNGLDGHCEFADRAREGLQMLAQVRRDTVNMLVALPELEDAEDQLDQQLAAHVSTTRDFAQALVCEGPGSRDYIDAVTLAIEAGEEHGAFLDERLGDGS